VRNIIITGGPGSGKTSLLNKLNDSGFQTFSEVPRFIIKQELLKNKPVLPWSDLRSFSELCFIEMMTQKQDALEFDLSFVDRAIGDILAYLEYGKLKVPELYKSEAILGYDNKVFILKPQENIYEQDEVRPHTFQEALIIHDIISKTYRVLGFQIFEIPYVSLETQLEMIKKKLIL
jgi:predicted ATPase